MLCKMPKISIIIPVYKAENSLIRCLDSIVAQTYLDWECLLIDDGSPDNSAKICDEYSNHDSRFRVFHKENGGPSSARNYGLDHAKGDYLAFIDSDDWVDKTFLDDLLKPFLENSKVGMTVCGLAREGDDHSIYPRHKYSATSSSKLIYDRLLRGDGIKGWSWNKMFKSSIWGSHRYPQGISYLEDLIVILEILAEKEFDVVFVPEYNYHYQIVNSQSSLSHNAENKISMISKVNEYFLKLPNSPSLRFRLVRNSLNQAVALNQLNISFVNQKYHQVVDDIRRTIKENYAICSKWLDKKQKLACRLILIDYKLFRLIYKIIS